MKMLKIIVLVALVGACFSSFFISACDTGQLSKIKCAQKNRTVFPDLLATNLNKSSTAYIGELVNWNTYEKSLNKLFCACINKAKEERYIAFTLSHGYCYGTKDRSSYDAWLESEESKGPSYCVNHNYDLNKCNNNEICVGNRGFEYIYKLFVDGGYGKWSDFGECSKSCEGGSKTRTRQCDSPVPAHGGKQCNGDASESFSCNTQPCLGAYTCKYHNTNFDDDGKGRAVYLDRHTLHCPSGHAIKEILLERNNKHTEMRYRYACCSAQISCNSRITNAESFNGGNYGNATYLTRQIVNCSDKAISYLKLDRSGDLWNYKYDCCKYTYSKSNVSCYDTNTTFNDDGHGRPEYLALHNMACNSNYFITEFKLVRNSDLTQYRYEYRCCKVDTP